MENKFLFSDVLYSETVGSPPSFYLNYTTRKHVQSYTVTAKLIIHGVITDKSDMVEYTLLIPAPEYTNQPPVHLAQQENVEREWSTLISKYLYILFNYIS